MTSMLNYSHSLLADFLLIYTHQTGWNKEKKNNPKYLQVVVIDILKRETWIFCGMLQRTFKDYAL